MTYPFVPARYDYGRRTRPALAFVLHMAEGGGTVGYLAKDNPNKVSVHYVVERTGRIVQMLREDRLSGSLRPTAIRRSDDPPFVTPDGATVVYGMTAARAVMGQFWSDPNSAVLSVEVEGFANVGPNGYQTAALSALVADIRTRYPAIGLLGHRDFADYKACPGKKFPWGQLGGHGKPLPPTDTEDDVRIAFKAERWALDGGPALVTTLGAPRKADGEPDWTQRLALLSGAGGADPRLELIDRKRLGAPYTADLDPDFYRALSTYRLPDGADAAYNAGLDAAEAAVAAVPRR